MSKFIALLRGINVSGQKKIKMAEFKVHLENAGLQDVQTYIQSGNIVFSSTEKDADKLARKIEQTIQNIYDFHVPTLVLKRDYLTWVLENNPFQNDPDIEIKKIGFAFLYAIPVQENIDKLMSYNYPDEKVVLKKGITYLYYGNGAGKAKTHNNFIENKLKVTASSRNYNTVFKLIEMSK